MSKTVKILLWSGGALLVLLVALKSTGVIGNAENATEVQVETVGLKTIVETVNASGKIQPEIDVKISPEVSGEIIELPIREGDEVKKGDLLVRINPDLYRAALSRAEASVSTAKSGLDQAKAQLVEAQNNFDRNKKLHEQGVISNAEWDAANRTYQVSKLSVESAKFQLESANAGLREAQDNLKRTTILAPNDGTVSALNVENGERVVGTAQMAGTEMLTVANLNQMEVLVEVNENDIVKVKLGDTAIVEVDAYLGEKFKGIVTEIANSAKLSGTSVDQITNFEVKIRILKESYDHLMKGNMHSPFRPGMTASVDIRTNVKKDILAIPVAAVTTRSDTSSAKVSLKDKYAKKNTEEKTEDFEVVFLLDGNKSKLQVVKTGIQDDKFIEILSGLEDSAQIITGPYEAISKNLGNGTPVKKKSSISKDK